MTDLLNTKNTLNITYNYDKTNQKTGYFTLDLRQDNKTYVPKQLNTDSVTYYKEGGYEIKTWPAKLVNGKIVLQATDFPDLRKAGTYVIRATVDGIIFPSQGKCTLTLNGDFSADTPIETQIVAGHNGADGASITNVNVDENGLMTVTLDNGKSFTSQIRMPETVKGDPGDKGSDGLSAYQLAQQAGFRGSLEEWLQSLKGKDGLVGKNAAEITDASLTGKTLTFKLSDNSSYSVELPLLKGDKGDAGLTGKDAPTINNATIDGNTLTFDMSDSTKHSVILPLLKGDRGEAGQSGKDAPKITNVTLNGNTLNFDLSDSSTYSVNLPLLKGDRGEAGQTGKDAPKITGVTLKGNTLTFDLSDSSTYSVVLPLLKGDRGDKGENGLSAYQIAQQAGFSGTEKEWLQSLKGDKGDSGLPGKDAPKITDVTLNDDQTQIVFTMSDGTKLESSFKTPTAIPGKDGKDAPTITGVNYQENKLVFTLSDSSTISAALPDLTGPAGQKGSDGLSAYEIAVKDGFKGSEQEWLQSLKGQKGDSGLAGQNAPTISSVKFENGQLIFTLSDNSSVSTPLTLPKGDDGKDAPKFTNVNYQNGELIFTLSDKTTISTPLTLPKGDNGTPGKDAPKITNVTLSGNTLTFDLSDSTSYNTTLPLLKGDKGDPGQSGKDAPKITKASYVDGTLTFTLSDNSSISTPLKIEGASDQISDVTFSTTPYSPKYTNDPENLIVATLKYESGKTKSFPIAGDHPSGYNFDTPYVTKIVDDTGYQLPSLVSRNHDHFTIKTAIMNPGLYQRNGKFVMVDMNGSMGDSETVSFKPIFDEIDANKETMFVADSDPNFKKIDWHISSVSANSDNFSQVTRLFFLLSPTVVYLDLQTGKPFAQPKIAVPTTTFPQETEGTFIDSSTFEIYYQIWDLDSMPLNPEPTFFDPTAYSTAKNSDLVFFGNRQSILSCPIDPSKIPTDKQELFKLIKPQPFDTSVNLYLHFK